MALTSAHAQAVPLKWTLQDWTFSDGGTASGSFVFDAATTTYSDIMVQTSGGGQPTRTYDANALAALSQTLFFTQGTGPDFTNVVFLSAALTSAMTDAGGTISLFNFSALGERRCDDPSCTFGTGIRSLTGGSIVAAAAVPVPAALPLMLSGLLAFAAIGRRRKSV